MPESMRWIGLDVHGTESTAAIFAQATGEVVSRRVRGRPGELLDLLREVDRPLRRPGDRVKTDKRPTRRSESVRDWAVGSRATPGGARSQTADRAANEGLGVASPRISA